MKMTLKEAEVGIDPHMLIFSYGYKESIIEQCKKHNCTVKFVDTKYNDRGSQTVEAQIILTGKHWVDMVKCGLIIGFEAAQLYNGR